MAANKLPPITRDFQPFRGCVRCHAAHAPQSNSKPTRPPRWFYKSFQNSELVLPELSQSGIPQPSMDTEMSHLQKVQMWLQTSFTSPDRRKRGYQKETAAMAAPKFKRSQKDKPEYPPTWVEENRRKLQAGMIPSEYDMRSYWERKNKKHHPRMDYFTESLTPNKEQRFRKGAAPIERPYSPGHCLMKEQRQRYGDQVSYKRGSRHFSSSRDFADQRDRTYELHSQLKHLINKTSESP